jgi:hypothetical protein
MVFCEPKLPGLIIKAAERCNLLSELRSRCGKKIGRKVRDQRIINWKKEAKQKKNVVLLHGYQELDVSGGYCSNPSELMSHSKIFGQLTGDLNQIRFKIAI